MVWTKLHDLCGGQESAESAVAYISLHPEEMTAVDDRGYTPLHVEMDRTVPRLEVVKALLRSNPTVAKAKEIQYGCNPLHLALRREVAPSIIQTMLDACRTVAYEKDKEGLMPLHAACRHCPGNQDVIRILIKANPGALHARTRMGTAVQRKSKETPLLPAIEDTPPNAHLVLDGRTSSAWKESQIQSMANQRHRDKYQQIRDGSYPLLIAIANGAPKQVVKMLFEEAPDVASKTDKFGRTCLHLATQCARHSAEGTSPDDNAPSTTLEEVMQIHCMHPDQVKTRDKDGQLPLHSACESSCSVEIVQYLVKAFSEAVSAADNSGKRPLDVAGSIGRIELIDLLSSETSDSNDVQMAQ